MKKYLRWIAFLLTAASIALMFLFTLDSFSGDASFLIKLSGFLIHNIPALAVAIILVIAWRYQLAGGGLLILAFIAAAIFFHSFSGNPASLIVISPFLISGILLIVSQLLPSPHKKN
jgi:hypothetical protein